MAVRRGVVLVFVLVLAAVAVSVAGLVFAALLVGREPRIDRNSTLVLRVNGDLQEMEPGGVIGQFFEAPPTVRSLVDALRKAKVDAAVTSVVIRPTGDRGAVGQGRRRCATPSSTSRRSRKPIVAYLEYGGEQEFFLASACDKVFLMPDLVARPDRAGELRAVPARDARQGRRLSRRAARRRLQDGVERLHRAHLHAGAPRDGGVAQHRPLRAAGARARGRPAQVRSRNPRR